MIGPDPGVRFSFHIWRLFRGLTAQRTGREAAVEEIQAVIQRLLESRTIGKLLTGHDLLDDSARWR